MYVLGFISTEKFTTVMLTYNAVMINAIYFKISRNGKGKNTGPAGGHPSSGD